MSGEDDWAFDTDFIAGIGEDYRMVTVPGSDAPTAEAPAGFRVVPGDRIVWLTDYEGSQPIAVLSEAALSNADVLMRIARQWWAGDLERRPVLTTGDREEGDWWVDSAAIGALEAGFELVHDFQVSSERDRNRVAKPVPGTSVVWAHDPERGEAEAVGILDPSSDSALELLSKLALAWAQENGFDDVLIHHSGEVHKLSSRKHRE